MRYEHCLDHLLRGNAKIEFWQDYAASQGISLAVLEAEGDHEPT
jgi:hypothetical protein